MKYYSTRYTFSSARIKLNLSLKQRKCGIGLALGDIKGLIRNALQRYWKLFAMCLVSRNRNTMRRRFCISSPN